MGRVETTAISRVEGRWENAKSSVFFRCIFQVPLNAAITGNTYNAVIARRTAVPQVSRKKICPAGLAVCARNRRFKAVTVNAAHRPIQIRNDWIKFWRKAEKKVFTVNV